ncbi:MAG: trypsin-like serine protease [Pseudomonadota bacterium]
MCGEGTNKDCTGGCGCERDDDVYDEARLSRDLDEMEAAMDDDGDLLLTEAGEWAPADGPGDVERGDAHDDDDDADETDDGAELFEDGYDADTHGGGRIEYVPGYDPSAALLRGLSQPETLPLPAGYDRMIHAGQAHYGQGKDLRESLCGGDDRTQVTDTSAPPWRMIAKLFITARNGKSYVGTGFFISPRTVMTAGHCVFTQETGGWAERIEVVPGMNGRYRPFGSATATKFRSVGGWTRNADPAQDYGCIVLPPSARLGDRTGWYGFASLRRRNLKRLLVNVAGYPADKAVGTQWFHAGRVEAVRRRRLEYLMDTFGGNSGGPAFRADATNGRRHVVGIHNYGGCNNKASRIDPALFRQMKDWKALGA